MPHAPSRRGSATCNEACDRLPAAAPGLVDNKLCRILLARSADLADHYESLRRGVRQKHLQDLDELGSLDRISSDPDRSGLAETFLRGLVNGLVGQRARTGHDADAAGPENIPWHDPDLALAGRHHPGTIRPDQARFRSRQGPLDLHHVEHRDALGDADNERNLGGDGFANRIGGPGRRHIDYAGVAAGLLLRLRHCLEYRQAEMHRASLARRRPADHAGAVGDRLFGMEGAVSAGKTLADYLRVFVDENAHCAAKPGCLVLARASTSTRLQSSMINLL